MYTRTRYVETPILEERQEAGLKGSLPLIIIFMTFAYGPEPSRTNAR
jgi:hypothetical protein